MNRGATPYALRGTSLVLPNGTIDTPAIRFGRERSGLFRHPDGRVSFSLKRFRVMEFSGNGLAIFSQTGLEEPRIPHATPLTLVRENAALNDNEEIRTDIYETGVLIARTAVFRESATKSGFKWYGFSSGLHATPAMALSGDKDLAIGRDLSVARNLLVTGNATATGTVQGTQLRSTVAPPTPPLSVVSNIVVPNLRAATAVIADTALIADTVPAGSLTADRFVAGQVPTRLFTTGVIGTPEGSITWGPIPQMYDTLEIRIAGRTTGPGLTEAVYIRPNDDLLASHYFGQQVLIGSGPTASAQELSGLNYAHVGVVPASGANPGWLGQLTIRIQRYSAGSVYRVIGSINYVDFSASDGSTSIRIQGVTWTGSGPITTLTFGPASSAWAAGSIISMYGLP